MSLCVCVIHYGRMRQSSSRGARHYDTSTRQSGVRGRPCVGGLWVLVLPRKDLHPFAWWRRVFLPRRVVWIADHSVRACPPVDLSLGGLSWATTPEGLREHVEKVGRGVSTTVATGRQTGKPRGCGFVTFADGETIDKVMPLTHIIDTKNVELKRAVQKGMLPPPSNHNPALARTGRNSVDERKILWGVFRFKLPRRTCLNRQYHFRGGATFLLISA